VIDGWLTEINVTSPTGIRQIDRFFSLNVAGLLFDGFDAHASRPAVEAASRSSLTGR
jgi:glutathione synthase